MASAFLFPALLGLHLAAQISAETPFDSYILAPDSRNLFPVSVFNTSGTVSGADSVLNGASDGSLSLSESGSSVSYDFGINVGGWVSFYVTETEGGEHNFTVGFSESSAYVSFDLGDASATDAVLPFNVTGAGNYTAAFENQRGAFRYLTLSLREAGSITISNLTVTYSPLPGVEDMRNYTGYFHCSDEMLNRVWYAGAYTTQICTIDPKSGNALLNPGTYPYHNETISNGTSVVVDGAKRDRLVWPGDLGVAVATGALSTYDLYSDKMAIDSLFSLQKSDGLLPYAGVGPIEAVSFTYHLYSLIGVYNVFLYDGDLEWLQGKWEAWKLGMEWALSSVDEEVGLMNVTSGADWLRSGMGGFNGEANSLLFHTLELGLSIANILKDGDSVAESYTDHRTAIQAAIDELLWDEAAGWYNDNTTTTMKPQDGNVWAVLSGVTTNETRIESILNNLQSRWTAYGPTAVEAGDAVSPFISSFELMARLQSNRTQPALDLMHSMWGDFLLDDPRMTNSTFIEGYSADGTLHYPPYDQDSRISYAHAWSTGPTSVLTEYIAGIKVTSFNGNTWQVMPQPGNLTAASAGFITHLGPYSSEWNLTDTTFSLRFNTPSDTLGILGIPTMVDQGRSGVQFTVYNASSGEKVDMANLPQEEDRYFTVVRALNGGSYNVEATYS